MIQVVGEVGEGISGIEASLDTQYILSTGNNITTWFWWVHALIFASFYLKIIWRYTAGRHEQQEPFLQWLIDLSDTEDAPLVNSASYSDKERTVDPDYMTRINTEFMKAGVRGLTLVSSRPKNSIWNIFSCLLVVTMALDVTITRILNPNSHHQVLTSQQLVVPHSLNRLVLAKNRDMIFLVVVSVISLICPIIKKN